ncbi:MAG TPA: hypothetical protein PK683_16850, partial [Leptospiraceae bacterium]|nr:hypothetical protein [Leptospiraceae bacterium]
TSDARPSGSIKDLHFLDTQSNLFETADSLPELTSLVHLDISDIQICGFRPLEKLVNLTELVN